MRSSLNFPIRIVVAAAVLAVSAGSASVVAEPVRAARTCPIVSGFNYHDANGNGLRDPGELALGGGALELRSESGEVVGLTVADADGYYEFAIDTTRQEPESANVFKAIFPDIITNWSDSREAPTFDAGDGILVAVDIAQTATITSSISAESRDSEPARLTATVSGVVSVSVGANDVLAAPAVQAGQFDAQPYDGESDFAGPSGHDFGEHTASDTNTVTVEGEGLTAFAGPEPVVIEAAVTATSNTSGSGNVLNLISTAAAVDVTLTYRFIPHTCLTGGTFTIVQLEQTEGYADGRETAGNQIPIPGTQSSDEITVTVEETDLPNANFGELLGSLAGNVYVDLDDDGNFDAQEPPISAVSVRLVGTKTTGEAVDRTRSTLADGSYRFENLFAGSYEIVEQQPAGYLDGKDTIGSQGGTVANDDLSIELAAGIHGVANNFGELPTSSPTAVLREGTVSSSQTPALDGADVPDRVYDVEVSKTPGAPGAGSGLAVGRSEVNLLLGFVFVAAVAAGVLLMVLGRSEPPRR